MSEPWLLALDLGLRAGLAWFDEQGNLLGYRSTHFPDRTRMKRGVHTILKELSTVEHIVGEGDPRLARIWAREGGRYGMEFSLIAAEQWRPALLLPRERKGKQSAKSAAIRLAKTIIVASQQPRPTSLLHDAAEAICIGHWWFQIQAEEGTIW